jgi:two-component system phosphate regulon response regulator PhoB
MPAPPRPVRAETKTEARGFYEITSATLGADLQSLTRENGAEFVVIGMLVPTREGLALCNTLRKQGVSESTVLMLRNMNAPVIPQTPDAAVAESEHEPVCAGEITIVPGRHEVKVNNAPVDLTRTELRILAAMARRPGWVFTRDKLIKTMHGEKYGCTERTIDVHITSLRRKLGGAGHYVETVRGVGYRFKP